jgi:hypothetical protein
MRNSILIILIIGLLSFCGGPEEYELSKVDIIELASKGTKITADNITVKGVNVNMNMSKVLDILKKKSSEIINDPTYHLKAAPGFKIYIRKDLDTIEAIRIYKEFKGLTGKTGLYFVLKTQDIETFLRKHLGEPKEIKDLGMDTLKEFLKREKESTSGVSGTAFEYIYPGGISFVFFKEKDGGAFSGKAIQHMIIQPIKEEVEKPAPPKLSIIDFRQVHWGMSRSQVKETEPKMAISKGDNSIYYREKFQDLPIRLNYVFENDRLIRVFCDFTNEYIRLEMNRYMSDFNAVESSLEEKYGESQIDRGIYDYTAKWENERSIIKLSLVKWDRQLFTISLTLEAKKEVADKF